MKRGCQKNVGRLVLEPIEALTAEHVMMESIGSGVQESWI